MKTTYRTGCNEIVAGCDADDEQDGYERPKTQNDDTSVFYGLNVQAYTHTKKGVDGNRL